MRVLIAFAAVCCSACVSLPKVALELGLARDLITQRRTDEAAVILLDERRVSHELLDGPVTIIEIHRAIRIEKSEGVSYAQLRIPYDESAPIRDLAARTLLPDGTSIPVDGEKILDSIYAQSGGGEQRLKTIAFPRAGVGAIVEYRYSIWHPIWLPYYEHAIDLRIPIVRASFELETFPGITVNHASRLYAGPEAEDLGMRQRFIWKLGAQDPPPKVRHRPPRALLSPEVSFAVARLDKIAVRGVTLDVNKPVFEDWTHVAEPYATWIENAVQEVPIELATPKPQGDAIALAKEAWARVQSRISNRRSFGRADGRPSSAADIAKSALGSNDDRALVILALLRAWGVPARALLVPSLRSEDPSEPFPAPRGLDDLLVWVDGPDQPLVLDPACLGCSPGELTNAHRGRRGLLFNWQRPLVAALSRSPDGGDRGEPMHVHYDLRLTPRGLVAEHGSWTAHGSAAAEVRHHFAEHPLPTPAQRDRMRKKYLDGVEAGEISIEGLEQPGAPLRLELENRLVRRDGYVQAGDLLILPIRGIFRTEWIDRLGPERSVPIHFRETPSFVHSLRLPIPAGHQVSETPRPQVITSPLGRYELTVKRDGGAIELEESLRLDRLVIAPEDYPKLHRLLEDVRGARRQWIAFSK